MIIRILKIEYDISLKLFCGPIVEWFIVRYNRKKKILYIQFSSQKPKSENLTSQFCIWPRTMRLLIKMSFLASIIGLSQAHDEYYGQCPVFTPMSEFSFDKVSQSDRE